MRLALLATLALLLPAALLAESRNPADYPLRVHVYRHNATEFYDGTNMEEAKGEGRANLFAAGSVNGIEFTYDCSQKLKGSSGYETYPAKWKKPNQVLTVLLPVFGKTGAYFTCDFKTDVKDFAFLTHDGKLGRESIDKYKSWMLKVDYDPEHGKNIPKRPSKSDDNN